jgi:hypothetical protein
VSEFTWRILKDDKNDCYEIQFKTLLFFWVSPYVGYFKSVAECEKAIELYERTNCKPSKVILQGNAGKLKEVKP